MCSNGIPGVRAFRLILVVGKRKNKPATLGLALFPLFSNYTNAHDSLSNLIQWSRWWSRNKLKVCWSARTWDLVCSMQNFMPYFRV